MEKTTNKTFPESMRHRCIRENARITDIPENNQISVVSYNILADCHVQIAHYHTYTDPQYLDMNYRHKIVMEELQYLAADVVCLQEVGPTYYRETLEPQMKSLGYEGFYVKRTKQFFDEGCATFFLSSKFELVSHNTHCLGEAAEEVLGMQIHHEDLQKKLTERYINRADILIVTKLQCKNCEHTVIICNTHLVWDNHLIPDVRCLQIFIVLKILKSHIDEDCDSFIICGDFNSKPSSLAYKIMTIEDNLEENDMASLKSVVDNADTLPVLIDVLLKKKSDISIHSSYRLVMEAEPEITNMDDQFQDCLDYIFFGNNESKQNASQILPVSVLDCPPLGEIKKYLPPSRIYPSDHLPIKTVFSIIQKQNCKS